MVNKYPPESATPNWPIKLKPDNFSQYCSPVLNAVTQGVDRVLNQLIPDDPTRILSDAELESLKENWLEKRTDLTERELRQLQLAYNLEVDLIQMLSDD